MPKLPNGLTVKQDAFCNFVFLSHNATQSAKDAKYSPRTAYIQGFELLRNPKIQARLAVLQQAAIPPEAVANAAIALVSERMALLSAIARHKVEIPVSAGHKVTAIAELNKMEGAYPPEKHIVANYNVRFVIGKGYKELEPGSDSANTAFS